MLAGVIFKIQTSEGIIVIESSHANVEVFVDGNKVVYLTDPKDKTKIKIEVEPGKHTLKVTKGGFEVHTTKFSLKGLDGKPIRVSLVAKEEAVAGDPDRQAAEPWRVNRRAFRPRWPALGRKSRKSFACCTKLRHQVPPRHPAPQLFRSPVPDWPPACFSSWRRSAAVTWAVGLAVKLFRP